MNNYCILCILFFSVNVIGQSSIGINMGITRSDFIDPAYQLTWFEPGYNFELAVNYDQSRWNTYYISYDLTYQLKSFYMDYYKGGVEFYTSRKVDCNLGYLHLGIYPGLKNGTKNQFYFNTGPYFGIILHSRVVGRGSTVTLEYPDYNHEVDESALEYFKPIDFGLSSKIGYKRKLNQKIGISTELRSFLSPFETHKSIQRNTFIKSYNVSFLVGCVYYLD